MTSEAIKLKDTEINVNSKLAKNEKNDEDKKTDIDEGVKKKITPFFNIRKIPTLSESIINYLVIGICFVLIGFHDLGWFKIEENQNKFYLGYFLVAGICLYVVGIFNWYEGKELIFLIDFVFSFYFLTIFLKNQDLGNLNGRFQVENANKLQGIFYILLFCLILIIGISSKEKGIVYIIDYVVMFVAFVFLFAYKFFSNGWLLKIYSYIFIICGAFLWITGILKILNGLINKQWKLMDSSD